MNKTYLIVIGILVVIIGFLLVRATTETPVETPTETPTETKLEQASTTPINDTFKNEFMIGCIGEDFSLAPYCECTYNYLMSKQDTKALIKMGIDLDSDIMSEETKTLLTEAMMNCLHLY